MGIVGEIRRQGGRAVGLHTESLQCLFGEPLRLVGDDGAAIDLGRVGRVTRVDRGACTVLAHVGKSGLWTSGSRMRRRPGGGVGFTNRFDHGDRRNFIARPARHKEEIL